jgi:hypothetical protein
LARDKLEKFADVKKMTERRLVLQEEMNRGSKDYKRLHDDIHPVQVKRRKKEDEVSLNCYNPWSRFEVNLTF